jgi:hypothetical protein
MDGKSRLLMAKMTSGIGRWPALIGFDKVGQFAALHFEQLTGFYGLGENIVLSRPRFFYPGGDIFTSPNL